MQNTRYHYTLLKGIQREWQALLQAVDQLSLEKMTTPDAGGWSPLDNLGHLTEWMKALLGYHLDHQSSQTVLGLPDELAENFDFQKVNAFLVERDRGRSREQVLDELKGKYSEVMTRLEAMPFEQLLAPRFPDDPRCTPLLDFVLANTREHFKEHRQTIEKRL